MQIFVSVYAVVLGFLIVTRNFLIGGGKKNLACIW